MIRGEDRLAGCGRANLLHIIITQDGQKLRSVAESKARNLKTKEPDRNGSVAANRVLSCNAETTYARGGIIAGNIEQLEALRCPQRFERMSVAGDP